MKRERDHIPLSVLRERDRRLSHERERECETHCSGDHTERETSVAKACRPCV